MNKIDSNAKYEYAFHHDRTITAASVQHLFSFEDWWPNRDPKAVQAVLEQNYAVGAWNNEELVGFARVISDGYFHAYLEEVIVHPKHRGQGIGNCLVEHLINALANIQTVSLFCKPKLVEFYTLCGFRHYPKQQMLHRSIDD